jgi:hypothetical protein
MPSYDGTKGDQKKEYFSPECKGFAGWPQKPMGEVRVKT